MTGGLAVAAGGKPPIAPDASSKKPVRPVVIVGAGVCGLSAARRLKDAGVPVLVLEGRKRVGGRTHTLDVAGDQASWVDMGAAWIDDHRTNSVHALLADAGAEVVPFRLGLFTAGVYDKKAGRWKGRAARAWTFGKFGWFSSGLRSPTSKFQNMAERIGAVLGKKPARSDLYLLRSVLEAMNGGALEDMHQNAAVPCGWEYTSYKEKSSVLIAGGYRMLVELFRGALSDDEVLTERAVSRISVPEDGGPVKVETSDGMSFEGSRVIVTVPLGVLKAGTIAFDPPLPESKSDVIRRIGFGTVEKIAMTFRNAFWRGNGGSRGGKVFFSVPDSVSSDGMYVDVSAVSGHGQPGSPSSPCLVCVFGARDAERTATDPAAATARMLEDLEAMFPETYEAPLATAVSDWTSSEFSRGCYAYPGVNTRPGDFAELGRPTHGGRVHFAGEACAEGTFLGSVEGAMVSGERAAGKIIAD